jgi:chromosome segregation ATPase
MLEGQNMLELVNSLTKQIEDIKKLGNDTVARLDKEKNDAVKEMERARDNERMMNEKMDQAIAKMRKHEDANINLERDLVNSMAKNKELEERLARSTESINSLNQSRAQLESIYKKLAQIHIEMEEMNAQVEDCLNVK